MSEKRIKDWFMSQSLDHPKRTTIITLLISILMGSGLQFFKIEDDMMKMIPENIETRRVWEEVKDEFGNTEMIFVAFGERGTSAYNREAMAELWDFTEVVEASPLIEEVISLSNMNRMESVDDFLEVDDLVPSRDLDSGDIVSIKNYLDGNPDIRKRVLGKHGDFFNIVVKPQEESNDQAVVKLLHDYADTHLKEYEVHFGGPPYLTGLVGDLIRVDMVVLIRIGLLGMVLILLWSLRSFVGVGMVVAVIVLSLGSMMGAMGWIYNFTKSDNFVFTIMNTSMPIILLTIANSDGVHFLTKFFKKLRQTKDKRKAIEMSMHSLMLPIFLTSITTSAAFLSLLFAPIEVMAGYGYTIAIGIMWAWILSTTLLPSLIMLTNWKMDSKAISQPGFLERVVDKIGKKILKAPRLILTTGLIVVLIGAYGLSDLNVEVNIKSFFSQDHAIPKSLTFLDEEMVGSMDYTFRIEGDLKNPKTLKKMVRLQEYMEEHPKISISISIADIIKQMHRTIMDDDPAFETIPDERDKVNNLFTMYAMSGDPDDFSALVNYDYTVGLVTVMSENMSTQAAEIYVGEVKKFIEQEINGEMEITTTGMLPVLGDMVDMVISSSFRSIFASIIVVSLIAGFFFRRIGWGLLAVIPLSSAVILNFGFMGLLNIDLNHVTAVLSSVIIGVGVDFAIHYISQYRRSVKTVKDPDTLSRKVIDEVGYPIVLDALSNMAFASLLFSQFLPVQHMGGLMVFAMISTSVGTLTILASIMELLRRNKKIYNRLIRGN